MKKKYIYFDNAATAIKNEFFVKEHIKILEIGAEFINKELIINSLIKKIASYLNVSSAQISLVPSATYASNEIANFISVTNCPRNIYIGNHEHLSVVLPWLKISKEKKWKIIFFNPEKEISKKIKQNSIIVVSSLTNLIGFQIDLNSLQQVVQTTNSLLIIDATQTIQHKKLCNLHVNSNFFFSQHTNFLDLLV